MHLKARVTTPFIDEIEKAIVPTMTRPEQVRAIFHELRRTVGGNASAREILVCADSLVALFSQDDEPHFDTRVGSLPFENWAMDVAMADGGWRILWDEIRRGTDFTGEEWEGFQTDREIEPIRLEMHV